MKQLKYIFALLLLAFAGCDIERPRAQAFGPAPVEYSAKSPEITLALQDVALPTQPGKYRITLTGVLTVEPYTETPAPPPVNPGGGTPAPPVPPVIVSPHPTTFQAGSNTFPWVPLSKYSDIGLQAVRTYCPWHWVYTQKGLFIEPMFQAWTPEAPGIDTYLKNAKAQGLDVLMCFNQTPEWLRPTGNGTGGNDYPPLRAGLPRTDPASYAEYAEFFFQVTARYGRVVHPESALRVDVTPQYANQPTNLKKSGLNLLRMIEIGNELDHWFSGFEHEKYMKPAEHAALLSACYDAVKRADPSMVVVMAGITDLNLPYLKAMQAWAVANRPDKMLPCDVVNVHHYSNTGNRPGTDKPTWAMSGACYPEQDQAFSQINEIVAWARSLGKKCYVTEFGADTKPPSMMHIRGTGGLTDEQAQSELILRTFRAYRLAGVDAAYVFNGCDENAGADGGQFETSGIMTSKATGYQPKPAYQALKSLMIEFSAN